MIIYIVDMLRFGNVEGHHYVLGAYSTRDGAKFAAESEERYRAGKYQYSIIELNVDPPVETAWNT